MDRSEVIRQTVEYFRSNQWRDIVQMVQERNVNHLHVYVDTSLHPYNTLAPLVKGYFEMRGWQVYREIRGLSSYPNQVALYNVDLKDKPNFEIYCYLTEDVALAAARPEHGERGGNLRVWWDQDIRRFQEQFAWRTLSAAEEAEVAAFFQQGKHWQQALDYVVDPDVIHVHCNIETSVHPNVLRKYALTDLAARGWLVEHAIHSLFNGGGYDSGKIIFLGMKPERTYDIAYYFNPAVLIQTNTQETRMKGDEGTGKAFYVLRKTGCERELARHQFHSLTNEEIQGILKTAAGFETRSAYSWRIIPT